MMMKKRTLMATLMILFLLISTTVHADEQMIDETMQAETMKEELPVEVLAAMELQRNALDAYATLWESFEKDSEGMPIYPDEYAGEYIEGENLIILLVGRTKDMEKQYIEQCGCSEYVQFEDAQYSLNFLADLESYVLEWNNDYQSWGME